jgi:co-chaperonin GroES (HSP10)
MINLKIGNVKPAGYSILVELYRVNGTDDDGILKSKGGIALDQGIAKKENESVQIAKVLDIGRFAYSKLECGCNTASDWGTEIGKYVLFDSHCGRKVSTDPKDLRRLLTDQEVRAIVELEEE